MKTRLLNIWEITRASYLFLPGLLTVLGILLSIGTIRLDRAIAVQGVELLAWMYTGGADGVRTLLSTLAGSMMTMVSVTFSITIVALTLASSQFGPRLLDNYMRDTSNQIVLGTFMATFIYSLLVLRTVRSVEESIFVPHISVTLAVFLAVLSLGLFIYFIHHAVASIHVQNVIATIGEELDDAIERLFPERKGLFIYEYELRSEGDLPERFDEDALEVIADRSGYLQTVDNEGLMELAVTHNLLLRIENRPGDFIAAGNVMLRLWPGDLGDENLVQKAFDAFTLGAQRLRLQDVEFAIDQLVELAVRALSPGINDPFTAIACVDRLGVALSRLAERQIPSGYRYDEENNLRLIADSITFVGVVENAFSQIRQHGRTSVAVTIRLLETLAVIGMKARTAGERDALRRQAEMIQRSAVETVPAADDRNDIEKRYQMVMDIVRTNES